jgi:hypothetical protein
MLIIGSLLFISCRSNRASMPQISAPMEQWLGVSAPVIVYKTKRDYFDFVPVGLNNQKDEIISYPHPKDIKIGEDYALPIKLKNNYLLDRRGIGIYTVFTYYRYKEYAVRTSPPNLETLMEFIQDKNPFTEIWLCGQVQDYSNIVKELNKMIKNNSLKSKCRKIQL